MCTCRLKRHMMMTCYPLQKLKKGAVSANLTSRKQLAEMSEDLLEVQQPVTAVHFAEQEGRVLLHKTPLVQAEHSNPF